MGFRRFVNLVQLLALAGAVVFIVMLFAYRPGTSSASGGNTSVGARLFSASCARCHGAAGEGGIGPQLAGSVVRAFPDPQAEVEVVRRGRGAMPAFEGSLTYDEIQQVVNYTRSL
jgi:mono/diheme cytochrome c family protein